MLCDKYKKTIESHDTDHAPNIIGSCKKVTEHSQTEIQTIKYWENYVCVKPKKGNNLDMITKIYFTVIVSFQKILSRVQPVFLP
jgi:hypothetical protein